MPPEEPELVSELTDVGPQQGGRRHCPQALGGSVECADKGEKDSRAEPQRLRLPNLARSIS